MIRYNRLSRPTPTPTKELMSANVRVPSMPTTPTIAGVWVEVMAYAMAVIPIRGRENILPTVESSS